MRNSNPWDYWLTTLTSEVIPEGFTRESWRAFLDSSCDQYQRDYAYKRRNVKRDTVEQHLSPPHSWWRSYISQNEETWDHLATLQHPLDALEDFPPEG